VLREIERADAPRAGDAAPWRLMRRARGAGRVWSIRPMAGIAALLLATVLGAVGSAVLRERGISSTIASGNAAVPDGEMPDAAVPDGVVPDGAVSDAVAAGAGHARHALGAASVVRFALIADGATRVTVVGDFNRWDPTATPLHRGADGRTWSVAVPLAAGRHVYAFVVDGGLTADPTAPRAAEDDFGAPNSVVVVSEAST